ncbi:MAG: hypothetical protein ACE5JN_15660 [Candidatus Methylomirabilia bacterium]
MMTMVSASGQAISEGHSQKRTSTISWRYRYSLRRPPNTGLLERFVFGPTLDARYDTLERNLALFGSGAKADSLFNVGPHDYLVGRRLSGPGVKRAASVAIELEQASVCDDVDPEATLVPARIVGRVRADGVAGGLFNLAIAVTGTIRAVTRTFDSDGREGKFTAMVPETALRRGKNSVEVFVVSAEDGDLERTNQISGSAR